MESVRIIGVILRLQVEENNKKPSHDIQEAKLGVSVRNGNLKENLCCNPVVKHLTHGQEIMGSNPTGLLSLSIHSIDCPGTTTLLRCSITDFLTNKWPPFGDQQAYFLPN